MRAPSIKTLSLVFSPDKVQEARRILKLEKTDNNLTEYASVTEYRRWCYRPQRYMVKLLALNELESGLHGVETIESENTGEYAEYLNTGETYTPTIIY